MTGITLGLRDVDRRRFLRPGFERMLMLGKDRILRFCTVGKIFINCVLKKFISIKNTRAVGKIGMYACFQINLVLVFFFAFKALPGHCSCFQRFRRLLG